MSPFKVEPPQIAHPPSPCCADFKLEAIPTGSLISVI